MRIVYPFLLSCLFITAAAQVPAIIPQPASITMDKGEPFSFSAGTVLCYNTTAGQKIALLLNDYLFQMYQFRLKMKKVPWYHKGPNTIVINDNSNKPRILQESDTTRNFVQEDADSYDLTVTDECVFISGRGGGLLDGAMTFLQLLPAEKKAGKIEIPGMTVYDSPRFAYRGMHLDCARHFFPVDFVKKYIDYLVLHKFNTFHWHLTDDQGWRIEIKRYPDLTKKGAWRSGTLTGRYPGTGNTNQRYGGFYTQAQTKEIVKYAADRYITIIPEIEMPGHGSAAIAAYPYLSCFPAEPTKIPTIPSDAGKNKKGKQVQETWGVFEDVFCAGKDSTFAFLQNVLDEVMTLFPGKYIHVGGDECPKENWKRCTACQLRMKTNGLKDEHELQSYFIQRMEKYLNKRGRTLIGWDEILEGGLAPKAVVMSWRGEAGGIEAAKQNHDVIMTPGNPVYFDHAQSENEDSITIGGFNPLEKVYAYEPVPAVLTAEQAKHILGAQANLWTEYITNPKKVEYMLFPRMAALSEVLWSPKEKRNWDDFEKRLQVQFKRYDLWGADYSKAYWDLKTTVIPAVDGTGLLWKIESRTKEYKIAVTRDTYHGRHDIYEGPVKIDAFNNGISAFLIDDKGKTIGKQITQRFHFNKATGKKISLANPPSKSYPGDGAFTLVNGIQNEKGMARSKEFLGFSGADCEAVIDLGKAETISSVTLHALEQTGSWIWRPASVEVFISADGTHYEPKGSNTQFIVTIPRLEKGKLTVSFAPAMAKFVKIIIRHYGIIPSGNPGASEKAWLFVDEIEVN